MGIGWIAKAARQDRATGKRWQRGSTGLAHEERVLEVVETQFPMWKTLSLVVRSLSKPGILPVTTPLESAADRTSPPHKSVRRA